MVQFRPFIVEIPFFDALFLPFFSVNIIFVPQKLPAMVSCIREKTPNSADDKVSLHPKKAPV